MTQAEQVTKIVEHVVEIRIGLQAVKEGQERAELLFTNHLTHHREDRIKSEDRFSKWVWVSVPTLVTLFMALVWQRIFS